jgi:hypothetical protein
VGNWDREHTTGKRIQETGNTDRVRNIGYGALHCIRNDSTGKGWGIKK